MPDEFVSIDLETTGLNLETDEITEIGATRFDRSGHAESYSTFVNPGRPIPPEIQRITSITDADVAGAPRFEQVAGDLIDFVGDLAIVGQNVQFDIGFLSARDVHFAGPTYDTWELASVLLPRAERLNLATLAESLGIVGVLVACQAAVNRLSQLSNQSMAGVVAGAGVFQNLGRQLAQTECSDTEFHNQKFGGGGTSPPTPPFRGL